MHVSSESEPFTITYDFELFDGDIDLWSSELLLLSFELCDVLKLRVENEDEWDISGKLADFKTDCINDDEDVDWLSALLLLFSFVKLSFELLW